MNFISLSFLITFVLALIVEALIQKFLNTKYTVYFLLIFNYVFYALFDVRFCLLLLLLTITTYISGLNTNNKFIYRIGIIIPVIILCFFKYFNFFLSTLRFETLNIILPIGISFYTFESISYLVDIKRNKIEAENNFVYFAAYLSFFPKLVSGPICRASNLLKQIKEGSKVNLKNIEIGIQIMAIGFFKKMVIADRLNVFTTDVFTRPKAFNWLTIALAVISYSIQIYMDFSGYSDIAIGCAKCLGFDLDTNFNLPYISKNITEFWRRWHISLSSWFKDYVYIPLGGNRKGLTRQLLNLVIVMSLSGLWHGSSWNYVLWGFINAILLCLEKTVFNKFKSTALTFILISLTWIFFRSNTFIDAIDIFRGLLTLQEGISQPYTWSIFSFIVVSIYTYLILKKKKENSLYSNYLIQNLTTIKGLTLFLILIGLIICFAYTNSSPFVYAQF